MQLRPFNKVTIDQKEMTKHPTQASNKTSKQTTKHPMRSKPKMCIQKTTIIYNNIKTSSTAETATVEDFCSSGHHLPCFGTATSVESGVKSDEIGSSGGDVFVFFFGWGKTWLQQIHKNHWWNSWRNSLMLLHIHILNRNVYFKFPSKIKCDLTNGPLSKLLELLETQV